MAGNTYESVASIIAKEARVPVETVTLGTTFEDLAARFAGSHQYRF